MHGVVDPVMVASENGRRGMMAAMALLRGMGCDLAQGFLFGPPMPPDPFADWRDHYPAGAAPFDAGEPSRS